MEKPQRKATLLEHYSHPLFPQSTSLPPLIRKPSRALKNLYRLESLSNRIPHKYDHFHEKTFELDFVPKFYVERFGRRVIHPRTKETILTQDTPEPPAAKHTRVRSLLPPAPQKRLVCKSQTVLERPAEPATEQPPHPSSRPVLCVQDGSFLDSADLQCVTVDLRRLRAKYIGCGFRRKPADNEDTLGKRGLQEIVEIATETLKPSLAFSAVYLVHGERVKEIEDIPQDCEALVLGWENVFVGLR